MRQHDVGIAAASELERLAAAHGDDVDAMPRLSLEHGEQTVEEARIARGRRGGQDDVAGLRRRGWRRRPVGNGERSDTARYEPYPAVIQRRRPDHHLTCIWMTPRLLLT